METVTSSWPDSCDNTDGPKERRRLGNRIALRGRERRER